MITNTLHWTSRMPPRKRSSTEGNDASVDWVASDVDQRSRPWAYEELLFGSREERERARELDAVAGELEAERIELARLHGELDAHLTKITKLDRRLKELTADDEPVEEEFSASIRASIPHSGHVTVEDGDVRASGARRSYSLARCEGFRVDSPEGVLGFVEGLRFFSRIDRPDLLEVRGGRLGRRLLLIPVDQVEEVRDHEARVIVRSTPALNGDLLDELVERVRRVLHVDGATS